MGIKKFCMFAGICISLCVSTPVRALQFSELALVGSNAQVENTVRAAFADIPILIAIAQCESGFRQFAADGTVLLGGGGKVIGIYQLSFEHTAKALLLGYDIQTIDGNIAYARYLYGQQGITPWMAAFPCWGTLANPTTLSPLPPMVPPVSNATSSLLVSDLSFGMDNPEVKVLQQVLYAVGVAVAVVGPGSPGNETTSFGTLTRAAVRKFQCQKNITCIGDEYTSGYGLVNAITRQALVTSLPESVSIQTKVVSGGALEGGVALLNRELQIGMAGSDVSYVQTFLKQQGFFTAGVNGVFGPITRTAVIGFQKKYALTPAFGYIGPKTLAKIKQLASQ